MKAFALFSLLMITGCSYYAGHCYFFAADYLVNGDAQYWPAWGWVDDALEHVAPDRAPWRSSRIMSQWIEHMRCVVDLGDHIVAIRMNEGQYETFDFIRPGGWQPFEERDIELLMCMPWECDNEDCR